MPETEVLPLCNMNILLILLTQKACAGVAHLA